MRTLTFTVPSEFSEKPLLYFLKGKLGFSHGIVGTLRHTEGAVKVNGKNTRVVDRVFEGDILEITLPEKTSPPELWETELDIVYEDDDLIIINKPAGLSCHPSHNHPNFTLANAVAAHVLKSGGEASAARAVGRLDKGTSGLILFAKHAYAASLLNGTIEKIYIALASRRIEKSGVIDAPIYRPDPLKTLRATGSEGDAALTKYEVLKQCGDCTLLKVKIETGRTHQIRVHLKSVGAPLVGDDMYGGPITENLSRPALHCAEIFFTHPTTGEKMHFSQELPDDIKAEINSRLLSRD